jgi:hypothetical protein
VELGHLRYFVAVAEMENVSRAEPSKQESGSPSVWILLVAVSETE